jgi:hypothetical protein
MAVFVDEAAEYVASLDVVKLPDDGRRRWRLPVGHLKVDSSMRPGASCSAAGIR